MRILDKIRKFCEGDPGIDRVTVSTKMFYDILAEEKFPPAGEVRFVVSHPVPNTQSNGLSSMMTSNFCEVVVSTNTTAKHLRYDFILLNDKYPRKLDNYPTPEFPYGDGVTPAEGYGKSIVENMTPICDHEFVNVGFSTLKMVCKKCDKEQV